MLPLNNHDQGVCPGETGPRWAIVSRSSEHVKNMIVGGFDNSKPFSGRVLWDHNRGLAKRDSSGEARTAVAVGEAKSATHEMNTL
jgi:hypothetical protein